MAKTRFPFEGIVMMVMFGKKRAVGALEKPVRKKPSLPRAVFLGPLQHPVRSTPYVVALVGARQHGLAPPAAAFHCTM
jgi:hypothetical protein